jgi:hypothetical protein
VPDGSSAQNQYRIGANYRPGEAVAFPAIGFVPCDATLLI